MAEFIGFLLLAVYISILVGIVSYDFGWQRGFDKEFERHMDEVQQVMDWDTEIYQKLRDIDRDFYEKQIEELKKNGAS